MKCFNQKEDVFTKELANYAKRQAVAEKKYETICVNEKRDEMLGKFFCWIFLIKQYIFLKNEYTHKFCVSMSIIDDWNNIKIGAGKEEGAAKGKGAPAKAKAPPPKKGAKGGEVQLSKQEQDKINTENEITKCKEMTEKYKNKQIKLKEQKDRFEAYLAMEDVKLDIVDKLGERKFMNTKLDQIANTF